jgi:CBS domain containing-hemolysin-like protein
MTDPTVRARFRDFLQRLLDDGRGEPISEATIQSLVDAAEEEGLVGRDENEMIQGIIELRDTVVREVMVPRPQVAALPADATLEDFLALLAREGHSRVPIYEKALDNVIGVVYSKDLLRHWGRDPRGFKIREVVRTPLFVPDSKRVKDLLQEFRRSRVHIAIVVDEYGSTAGIVTIEDLIEEIVGEIKDEYDAAEEDPIRRLEDGSYSVDPRVNLADLEDVLDTPLPADVPREEFDTVGGLIFHLAGRVPRAGETVRAGSLVFTVERATERRLGRVRVQLVPPSDETGEAATAAATAATAAADAASADEQQRLAAVRATPAGEPVEAGAADDEGADTGAAPPEGAVSDRRPRGRGLGRA